MSYNRKITLLALAVLLIILVLYARPTERPSLWDESRKDEAPPSYHSVNRKWEVP
jgi:hypothetical protein